MREGAHRTDRSRWACIPWPQFFDLGLAHAEEEEVVVAHELADLDVRTIVRADRERTVERELHVARAGRLLTGERDLLGQVGGRDDPFGKGHVVVRREQHLQPALDPRVVVDDRADGVDEVDDALGHDIPRRRLGPEDEGARLDVLDADPTGEDAFVRRHDVEHLEHLPLVLVQTLDHDIEHVPVADLEPITSQHAVQSSLVRRLDLGERRAEVRIVGVGLEPAQTPEISQPARTDRTGDQPDSSGFDSRRKRRGVTPLVTLVNLSG